MFGNEKVKTLLRMFQTKGVYEYFATPELQAFCGYVVAGQRRQAIAEYARVFPNASIVERYVAFEAAKSLGNATLTSFQK
ncbi:hypothetical protein ACN08X_04490 [Rothia sp. P6271]|uniref:hypothetical protein n=1 Tax=unclassified Rothia (in: high G+C Gram-positive bacteria) TaxID=2689056 RepID=UPI003AD7C47B